MLYFVLPLAQLYGHHHKDKIHILYPQDEYPLTYPQQNKTALLIAPSISPKTTQHFVCLHSVWKKEAFTITCNITWIYQRLMVGKLIISSCWSLDVSYILQGKSIVIYQGPYIVESELFLTARNCNKQFCYFPMIW